MPFVGVAHPGIDSYTGSHDASSEVSDGKSAIKWAEMVRPDAVVTDVIMPGMDGIEVAKALLKMLPNCRIILFSGQAASTPLLARARSEGYLFEVLAKPINPEILLEKLKSSSEGAGVGSGAA